MRADEVFKGTDTYLMIRDAEERRRLIDELLALANVRPLQFTVFGEKGVSVPREHLAFVQCVLEEVRRNRKVDIKLQEAFPLLPDDAATR